MRKSLIRHKQLMLSNVMLTFIIFFAVSQIWRRWRPAFVLCCSELKVQWWGLKCEFNNPLKTILFLPSSKDAINFREIYTNNINRPSFFRDTTYLIAVIICYLPFCHTLNSIISYSCCSVSALFCKYFNFLFTL